MTLRQTNIYQLSNLKGKNLKEPRPQMQAHHGRLDVTCFGMKVDTTISLAISRARFPD